MSFGACSCHGVTNSQQKLYLINLASLLLVEYLRRETSVKKKVINYPTFSVIAFLNRLTP